MGQIAITGATGFAGSHLVGQLAEAGHELKCLARPRRGREMTAGRGIEWASGTLGNKTDLEQLVDGADTVIHAAGLTRAIDADGFHETNTRATAMLVSAARKAGVRTFIFVSSLAASRPEISPYAWSKALAEKAAEAAAGDMKLIIVRPPAILGPGDSATRDVMALLRRGWLVCPGGSEGGTFSWIDVGDFAGLLADLISEPPSESFTRMSPCSGQDISWKDVASAAETALGREVRCIPIPRFAVRTIGAAASLVATITRQPLILSWGKASELLQPDWHADLLVSAPAPLHQTLSRCCLAPSG